MYKLKNQINKFNKKQVTKIQKNIIKNQLKINEPYIDVNNNIFTFSKTLSINDFAKKINKDSQEIIQYFMLKGINLNDCHILTEEQLCELCLQFGLDFKKEKLITHENLLENFKIYDSKESLKKRPPIVTIMGHVNHGKTTLLDTIRNSKIVTQEYGGITQHIGAYQITTKSNQKITFIDTPGHEAFTKMRVRGSSITDIIILVIAADDGIMPQTKEAIDHAKNANVPIIIFINKIDKFITNINNIMLQLSQINLITEEWGGNISCIKGSAKNKQGINELLETILLITELHDLKTNPNRFSTGTVLESHLNKDVGPTAILLVQTGTLKIKDALVVGNTYGYVRNMTDENGKKILQAGPSTPVIIYGLNELPEAGDKFIVFQDVKLAREMAIKRKTAKIINKNNKKQIFSLDILSTKIKNNKLKTINIILKADTKGTVEAIQVSLQKINIEGIKINIIYIGVGTITNNDIILAITSQAFIIGFNIKTTSYIQKKANDENIKIKIYKIIYKIIEEMEAMAKKMLENNIIEEILGRAEVRKLFKHSNFGTIAGIHIIYGIILRESKLRIFRNGNIIFQGEIASLKQGKNDIKEAQKGFDCGLIIKNFNNIQKNDLIETYIEKNNN